jgi:hexosaminidase
MRSIFVFYFIIIYKILSVCSQSNSIREFPIIPKPKSVQVVGGNYELKQIDLLVVPKNDDEAIRIGKALQSLFHLPELKIQKISGGILPKPKSISLSLVENPEKPDYYKIHVTKNGLWIQASKAQGWFYALQTLTQLVELSDQYTIKNKMLPYCIIEDEPVFSYRGLHLDVGRHFFPVAFIKKYIDLMSRFKYNTFHWHLTEDQGWRIEIKKFPRLTQIGSIRKQTRVGHASDYPPKYDSTEYKGFYTQEEIKEVIGYAKDRFIEVIPEIEMPGHSTAALAAYPEFSCSGQQVEVACDWGVFNTGVYCTKDTSLWFVKEILNEICDLFPGRYIHIGGDECPKENWKQCDQCQAIKRRNNLKSEEELQSYFIRNVEIFLHKKGKQLIGWDEILEGGLAPRSTIMSWQGNSGGIAAAKLKHPVIMCPGSHCYFDHYQSLHPSEPLAIGGYTPLHKTYSFNPVPSELKPEEYKYILGAQGNVWTEYMPDEQKIWYMAYPRAIALSEVNWTDQSNKNYSSFLNRLQYHIPWFRNKGMHIAQGMLDLDYNTVNMEGNVILVFKKPPMEGKILIESSQDGNLVSEYLSQDSFVLKSNVHFKTWFQLDNGILGRSLPLHFNGHLAAGKTISIEEKPSPKYFHGDPGVLINGIEAPSQRYGGPEWIGFEGTDINSVIDLGKADSLDAVKIQFFHHPGSWIHRPNKLEIRISTDCKNYNDPVSYQINQTDSKYIQATIPLAKSYGRFVKLSIQNHGVIADGMPGAGHKAWLFVGEIEIR